ncbi:LysR substrate-binding domain-containing protein [Spartinivicinus poritis]|uniref:LysR substrate-binding domain-containing protein n=1 Tax=Spartinivicinus poritis TaxID=2994640 RepID=A0ABT5U868_9GAMM|nr:LysR substrate-binding domain-containing protein [Spartinivicinus sp. A2-2]MDE1462512.1 LysR substrate-binding domain-containing protein [Spartinivicinus sp. A2-2]
MSWRRKNLPPLKALRAFEAAARHGSFTEAATELFVTQGAISRQVKTLEDFFNCQLFKRTSRGLQLTPSGSDLFQTLSESFDAICRTTDYLLQPRNQLNVVVPPTFSVKWLLPRLAKFQQLQPDVELSLTTMWEQHHYDVQHEFQAAIVNDAIVEVPNHAISLFKETMAPVCSPAFLAKHQLNNINGLSIVNLLHPTRDKTDWTNWLNANHVNNIDTDSGLVFDAMELAINAAVRGHGVAMVDLTMVQEELELGYLVKPFAESLENGIGYFLVHSSEQRFQQQIEAFKNWLFAEIALDQQNTSSA